MKDFFNGKMKFTGSTLKNFFDKFKNNILYFEDYDIEDIKKLEIHTSGEYFETMEIFLDNESGIPIEDFFKDPDYFAMWFNTQIYEAYLNEFEKHFTSPNAGNIYNRGREACCNLNDFEIETDLGIVELYDLEAFCVHS